jgi:hypothetical protein
LDFALDSTLDLDLAFGRDASANVHPLGDDGARQACAVWTPIAGTQSAPQTIDRIAPCCGCLQPPMNVPPRGRD